MPLGAQWAKSGASGGVIHLAPFLHPLLGIPELSMAWQRELRR